MDILGQTPVQSILFFTLYGISGAVPLLAAPPEYTDKYEWLVWEDEVHCFDELIAAMDERKRDVFWIFRPEYDDGSKDDKIRIVFWFDN